MANKVTFDYSKAAGFVQEHEMAYMSELVAQAKEKLVAKSGAGNDFLGWIDLPVDYDKEEFVRIQKAAEKIRKDSEVLLVIGIGGSYLGARAAIEFLGHSFANVVSKEIRKSPEIYYVGNSISSTYIKHLIDVVGDRDFSINMISKSGTTGSPNFSSSTFSLSSFPIGTDGSMIFGIVIMIFLIFSSTSFSSSERESILPAYSPTFLFSSSASSNFFCAIIAPICLEDLFLSARSASTSCLISLFLLSSSMTSSTSGSFSS